MHLVYPPKFYITIEDNGYAKFLGVNRVHYGLGENGQYQLLIHLMTGQL